MFDARCGCFSVGMRGGRVWLRVDDAVLLLSSSSLFWGSSLWVGGGLLVRETTSTHLFDELACLVLRVVCRRRRLSSPVTDPIGPLCTGARQDRERGKKAPVF